MPMFDWRSGDERRRLWRYYQAGVVNTLFGYAAFAALVALGLNIYAAQIIAHVVGIAFNYVTYSRYAFRGQPASRTRFVASYAVNYALSLSTLAGFTHLGFSPYAAGLFSVIVVSLINYFVLAKLVFAAPQPG
jgi:putative flippase GtrA